MSRATWGSKIGFIFAAAGSAIGLANIWRFPYVVGANGGSAFIILYLFCLLLIGFPVLIAEILIGRTTQTNPSGAFRKLGGSPSWAWAGKLTILTGFIVSGFYSAVAGWVLGYLFEVILGRATNFQDIHQSGKHFTALLESPFWALSFHFLFLSLCLTVLFFGVRQGIERGNKIMMPLLFVVLMVLVIKGLMMPQAEKGLAFLLKPNWNALTPTALIAALGQSFFTLSLGQGTMVTYGSYLGNKDNLLKSCIPVALMDTAVSMLASIAVFTIVFSVNMQPDSGPGLIFQTLPLVFSQIPGGYFLAILFFLLVVLAAVSSEISALEPAIAYLIDEKRWKRGPAVAICGLGAFLIGVPCSFSFNILQGYTFFGDTILDDISNFASLILIPIGGFLAVVMVGWIWGFPNALNQLKQGTSAFFDRYRWIQGYFWFCFKFSAPLLIVIVFLHALGVFSWR
jgi:NSS family neurotransmitter:Na+ symporter